MIDLTVGLIGALLAIAIGVPWQLIVLCAWVAAGTFKLATVWGYIFRLDAVQTSGLATREDDSRAVASTIVVTACTVSLVGAALALNKAGSASDMTQAVLTVAALVTIVVSWLVLNTEFTLRYAHLYFTPPVGGIDFPGGDEPDYRDFAYLAFTVGMAYSVSDFGLLSKRFRRTLLAHALLAYLFGTVIVASTIGIAASFVD